MRERAHRSFLVSDSFKSISISSDTNPQHLRVMFFRTLVWFIERAWAAGGKSICVWRPADVFIDLQLPTWATVLVFYEICSFNKLILSLLFVYPALLPPHMRPSANRQSPSDSKPLPSPNINSQTFTYDTAEKEPDLNTQPWDPNYSYTTPEGTGAPVNLPADTCVSPQATGTKSPFCQQFQKLLSKNKENINFYFAQLHLFLQDLHSWSRCQSIWCFCLRHHRHPLRNHPQTHPIHQHFQVKRFHANVTLTL